MKFNSLLLIFIYALLQRRIIMGIKLLAIKPDKTIISNALTSGHIKQDCLTKCINGQIGFTTTNNKKCISWGISKHYKPINNLFINTTFCELHINYWWCVTGVKNGEWGYCKEEDCKNIETERECLETMNLVTTSSSIQLNLTPFCQNKNCIVVLYTQTYKCLQASLCQEDTCKNLHTFVSYFFNNCQVIKHVYTEVSEYVLSPLTENTLYKIYIIQVLTSETIGSVFRMNVNTQLSKLLIPGTIKLISRTSTSIKLKWNSTKDLKLDSKIYKFELLNNRKRSNIIESDTLENLEICKKYCFKLNAYYYLEKYYTYESCFYTTPDVGIIKELTVINNTVKWSFNNINKCSIIFEGEYHRKTINTKMFTFQTDSNKEKLSYLVPEVYYLVRVRICLKGEDKCVFYGDYSEWVEFRSIISQDVNHLVFIWIPIIIILIVIIIISYLKRDKILTTVHNCREYFTFIKKRNSMSFEADTKHFTVSVERLSMDSLLSVENELELPLLEKKTPITKQTIQSFSKFYERRIEDNNKSITIEYKLLGNEATQFKNMNNFTTIVGNMKYNRRKNRFSNILPYDHNRVILKNKPDNENYINASYIYFADISDITEYIASQGPISTSVGDFWTMIWDEHINCIIMLTECYEKEKLKCTQYWPNEANTSCTFDLDFIFKVHLLEEKKIDGYIERKIDVYNKTTKERRRIIQMQMITWNDYSAPDMEIFEKFLCNFHKLCYSDVKTPYLIHCSAGVGRTGTFIAIDRIIRKLVKGAQEVDIFKEVLEIRKYRNFMVQRQAQYVFIYMFINYFINKYAKFDEENDDLVLYCNE